MADFAEQARAMSTTELHQALDWHQALREHADENMQFREYELADQKVKAIEAELRHRQED